MNIKTPMGLALDEPTYPECDEILRALSCKSQSAGYVPLPQCATQDNKGKHCPEKPTRDAIAITTGRHIRVCEKCFKSWSEQGIIKAHNEKAEFPKG